MPTFDALRSRRLLDVADFDEVLHMLSGAKVVGFRWKAFDDVRLAGCHRAEFRLRLEPAAYDAFFNSPVGIRGQYARSAAHGEAANRRAISLLHPMLVAFDKSAATSASHIEWSLCGSQAKIWIDEDEVADQLGQTEPQIVYQPWSSNSESGVGLLAPRGTLLEVKGVWLSSEGIPTLDPAKSGRGKDIEREGYT